MQNDKLNILLLADVHWGAIDPDEFDMELDSTFFGYISDLVQFGEQLDYIIIAGDLFDTKEAFSSLVVKKVIAFIAKMLVLTEPCNTQIVIIEGTRTHDNLQLDNLSYIFNIIDSTHRVTIYNTVEEIELGDTGKTALLIPEEYVADQESYYKEYFKPDCRYDLIIGHGMVDKVWYAKKEKESVNDLTKHMSAPVFKVDDLLDHCTKCYFGHVHMNKAYGDGNRFTYIGPYTNWEFGKTTKVGFYHIQIDLKTSDVTDRFIENTNAKNYPTVSMKIQENMSLTELNDRIDTLIASVYARTKNIGKIRLVVYLYQSIDTWQTMKDFLIGKCGDMPNLKFVLQLEENTTDMDSDEVIEDTSNKYLFDHSIDISHRIQTFIKNKSGRDISIETIEKYLNSQR